MWDNVFVGNRPPDNLPNKDNAPPPVSQLGTDIHTVSAYIPLLYGFSDADLLHLRIVFPSIRAGFSSPTYITYLPRGCGFRLLHLPTPLPEHSHIPHRVTDPAQGRIRS